MRSAIPVVLTWWMILVTTMPRALAQEISLAGQESESVQGTSTEGSGEDAPRRFTFIEFRKDGPALIFPASLEDPTKAGQGQMENRMSWVGYQAWVRGDIKWKEYVELVYRLGQGELKDDDFHAEIARLKEEKTADADPLDLTLAFAQGAWNVIMEPFRAASDLTVGFYMYCRGADLKDADFQSMSARGTQAKIESGISPLEAVFSGEGQLIVTIASFGLVPAAEAYAKATEAYQDGVITKAEYDKTRAEIAGGLSAGLVIARLTQKRAAIRRAAAKESQPKAKLDWESIEHKRGESVIDHVLRHQENMPGRDLHSYMKAGEDIIGATNEAWAKAQQLGLKPAKNGQLLVPMGRQVGWLGGKNGTGQPLSCMLLILKPGTNQLITAYPF